MLTIICSSDMRKDDLQISPPADVSELGMRSSSLDQFHDSDHFVVMPSVAISFSTFLFRSPNVISALRPCLDGRIRVKSKKYAADESNS